ncbi:MAG: hypothetical protein A2W01_10410 [Candidatus Solincola sediminis]|uniref:Lipoprotein n=1 Tax=Candidatus Solincola sediminis TaxID=1797199 RepID=A0A1F2WFT4_9ACTN|nr:MAG: hypothetical protein A2Y75_05990 [Candidatus Solincola sediminis]OFW60001.1 MAG: hypothetical protein A2W01_10410 [Candidatus Solincola sediminis]
MRKILVIALAAALALSLVAFIAGCGGDKDKDTAKQHKTDGDASWQLSKDEWKTIQDLQTQVTTAIMSGDLSSLQGTAATTLIKKFEDSFDTITTSDAAAKQQYTAISSLSGVQDYKDYASQMLQAIDLDGQRVMAYENLITSITSYIQSLPAGTTPDLQQLASNPDYARLTELDLEIEGIEKAADSIGSKL